MRLVYITLARKILCYGSFPAKVLLGTNAYNSQIKKGRRTSEVFSETTQGYHIANRLGEKNVEIILFNFFYPEYFNVNYSLPFANCTWDAAFELTDCQPVAISFHHSPFGKCKEKILGKRWVNWQTALSTTYLSTSINM